MKVQFNRDILQSELGSKPPSGNILDIFVLSSETEEWYNFTMVLYENKIDFFTPTNRIITYTLDQLRKSEFGAYRALIDAIKSVIESTCTYPGVPVEEDSILEMRANSLVYSKFFKLDKVLDAITTSTIGAHLL